MTSKELKEAEANGSSVLNEVKSSAPSSDGSSEDLPPFRKRSRRRECIYIIIAVALGTALVAVLVYFSVMNSLEKEPDEIDQTGANDGQYQDTTTEYYTTTDGSNPWNSGAGDGRGSPGDNSRSVPGAGGIALFGGGGDGNQLGSPGDHSRIGGGVALGGFGSDGDNNLPGDHSTLTFPTPSIPSTTPIPEFDRSSLLRGGPRPFPLEE